MKMLLGLVVCTFLSFRAVAAVDITKRLQHIFKSYVELQLRAELKHGMVHDPAERETYASLTAHDKQLRDDKPKFTPQITSMEQDMNEQSFTHILKSIDVKSLLEMKWKVFQHLIKKLKAGKEFKMINIQAKSFQDVMHFVGREEYEDEMKATRRLIENERKITEKLSAIFTPRDREYNDMTDTSFSHALTAHIIEGAGGEDSYEQLQKLLEAAKQLNLPKSVQRIDLRATRIINKSVERYHLNGREFRSSVADAFKRKAKKPEYDIPVTTLIDDQRITYREFAALVDEARLRLTAYTYVQAQTILGPNLSGFELDLDELIDELRLIALSTDTKLLDIAEEIAAAGKRLRKRFTDEIAAEVYCTQLNELHRTVQLNIRTASRKREREELLKRLAKTEMPSNKTQKISAASRKREREALSKRLAETEMPSNKTQKKSPRNSGLRQRKALQRPSTLGMSKQSIAARSVNGATISLA